jgi:Trk K+ transport system NAD-binding subunit
MKAIAAELAFFLRGRARKNIKVLVTYCAFLAGVILIYAVVFRFLMWHLEGREFSFIAGIYWTITVMTTLGFGDITFHSDPGYIFAAVVTVSGVIFLLIILPFGFVSLFLAPWIEHRLRYQPTYELPAETTDHVIIFGIDAISRALIRKLQARGLPFVVVTPHHDQAARLETEDGMRVVCGSPTDVKVIAAVRAARARHIVVNLSDPENVNICLTVRGHCQTPIAAVVNEQEHVGLLRLAGANRVVPLHKILGRYLAVRATTCGALAHILDSFGELEIAEMPVHGTPFAGLTLQDAHIRQRTGLSVIGIWERGKFTVPTRQSVLAESALMVLAGTREQLQSLERLTGEAEEEDLVFILGHGRIGCAAASFLERKPVPFILVDRQENPSCTEHVPIYGDATLRQTLMGAGFERAKGMLVTTNDDNTNMFLTLAGRHMQPHIRVVARANSEENVDQLYAAGADFVVSNASVGANILYNILESKATAFLTEGINVFRRALPAYLIGKTLAGSQIRQRTGCSIVAIEPEDAGETLVSPPPETEFEKGVSLILIGTAEQEEAFDSAVMDE